VFRSAQILHDYNNKHKQDFPAGTFAVLEESSQYKTNIIQKASKSGMITLIARSYGRGSDFACQDDNTRQKGGVHVIQTFLSESAAEECQIRGRTARQGDPGSYEMILWEEDLINAGKTSEEVEAARSSRALYDMLSKLRDDSHEQIVKGLMEGEQKAAAEHKRTVQLHSLLLNYTPANEQKIQQLVIAFNGCDQKILPYHFYFVLDDSGSMHRDWVHLMNALNAFIARRVCMCDNAGCPVTDLGTIINYSHTAAVMCEAQPLNENLAKHTRFRSGGTDFKVGLDLAYKQMKKHGNPSHKPVLVFMSDGGSSSGNHEIQLIARDFQPTVFVFGFGRCCAADRLKTMATIAGGEYHEGADGAQLKAAFEEVSTKVSSVSF